METFFVTKVSINNFQIFLFAAFMLDEWLSGFELEIEASSAIN